MYDIMKCRLCLQQAKLCNSHVIPEFFYEKMQLYDCKHRFNILSTEHRKHPRIVQKGIREKLLCKNCENKLSQWEGYAHKVLYERECIATTTKSAKGFECEIDYKKFKLFQLSILWRVGISTQDGFSSINLGKHETTIRNMLLSEVPGDTETYGCVILYSSKHIDITSNMIHCIGMSDIDETAWVGIMLGGFFCFFFLSKKAIDPRQRELFFQDTGHLRILMTNQDPYQFIEHLANDLYNANPNRFNQLKN